MDPMHLAGLLEVELRQRREEGVEHPDLPDRDTLRAMPHAELEARYDALLALRSPTDAAEPSELAAIRALRPNGPRRLDPDDAALPARVRGALLGRIAGCQLGKPVEGWHKRDIDAYLAAAGEDEIRDYLPYLGEQAKHLGHTIHYPGSCRSHLDGALRDDDQDYTILGVLLLEQHGFDVTSEQVIDGWLRLLPYHMTYTAEREAYRNRINGLAPPSTATWRNPYREWIGAQIRADGWAYAAAGNPELAAELAFRDAAVSHTKNGIYGEMFFAAAIAGALAADSLDEALEIGLSEIPRDCRLAQAVRQVLAWHADEPTWRGCWQRIEEAYGQLSWVHTINNAMLVLLGLLYGQDDFSATIGIAVHGGWDTDCNGATAGSVWGALHGAEALPAHWTAPLRDTVRSALFGQAELRIAELAERAVMLRRSLSH